MVDAACKYFRRRVASGLGAPILFLNNTNCKMRPTCAARENSLLRLVRPLAPPRSPQNVFAGRDRCNRAALRFDSPTERNAARAIRTILVAGRSLNRASLRQAGGYVVDFSLWSWYQPARPKNRAAGVIREEEEEA